MSSIVKYVAEQFNGKDSFEELENYISEVLAELYKLKEAIQSERLTSKS